MQHCIIQQYYKNSVQHLTCVNYVQLETCDNENLDMFIQLFSLKTYYYFRIKTMGVNYEPSKTSGRVLKKAQDKCMGVEKAKETVNL
jgi:hypothetical protein